MKTDSIFTATSTNGILKQLSSPIKVSHGAKSVDAVAIWDTGAVFSCISKHIAQELELVPDHQKNMRGPLLVNQRNAYYVDIEISKRIKFENLLVVETEMDNPKFIALIGMDIISQGDFAISNYDGVTVFSYRTPSQTPAGFPIVDPD